MEKTQLYKLVKPYKGEGKYVYIITGKNEITKRCKIECINSGMFINPTELVNFTDITEIK